MQHNRDAVLLAAILSGLGNGFFIGIHDVFVGDGHGDDTAVYLAVEFDFALRGRIGALRYERGHGDD